MNNQAHLLPRFVSNFADLAPYQSVLVLYSGGSDSSHALLTLKNAGKQVIAFRALVGGETPQENERSRLNAETLGAEYLEIDLGDVLAERFIAPAIIADARYHGNFPICSSLTRPAIAEAAARIASERGIEVIVHGSTWVQNSSARYNNSITACNSTVVVANPYASDPIDREQKVRELTEAGIHVRGSSLYSIDANLWGRVIEAGVLDDPAVPLPADVFEWTRMDVTEPCVIRLGFDSGLPVSIDGERMPLLDIVQRLNTVAGRCGVGRFNGLEEISPVFGGVKNHEVREAPAAAVIFEAKNQLELANLSHDELRAVNQASWEWTRLAVNGFWHTPLRCAYQSLLESLAEHVNGIVTLRLQQGSMLTVAVDAHMAPSFWNTHERLEHLMATVDFSALSEIAVIRNTLREQRG